MKKIVLILMTALAFSMNVQAQKIFNEIFSEAKRVMNDPNSNKTLVRLAYFKYNTLQYIHDKAIMSDKEVTTKFLDDQAYYMSQFINSLIRDAVLNPALTKSEKKDRIILFMDASCSNPIFKDKDRELVDAYVRDSKNQLTPFCLDTDWPKAYAAVMSKLKNK